MRRIERVVARTDLLRFVAALFGVFATGCGSVTVPRANLDPDTTATSYDSRRLDDPGLARFLAENLGRESPPTADFESLSWAAFYYHPSLALARAQWATAQAVTHSAAVPPNPTLTLTPGYNTTREAGVSPWMPGVNLDFLFAHRMKGEHQVDIARHDAEAVRLGIASAAWTVRSELRRALLDSESAARHAAALRSEVAAQRRILELLEQRVLAGAIASTETSTARSALLRAESALAGVTSQEAVARARTAAAIGIPHAALDGVTLPVPPALAPLSVPALATARREALRNRADVLAALAKYRAAQATLDLEIARQIPDFHVGPDYQWDQGANKWSLAISFELPLFHHNQAAIAEALARRSEAAAQFNLVQAQVIAAIDIAAAAQQAAALQVDHVRALRAEAERQQLQGEQRLAAGAADQMEIETARLDRATVELAAADADGAAAAAAGALEDALQVPFPHLAELN